MSHALSSLKTGRLREERLDIGEKAPRPEKSIAKGMQRHFTVPHAPGCPGRRVGEGFRRLRHLEVGIRGLAGAELSEVRVERSFCSGMKSGSRVILQGQVCDRPLNSRILQGALDSG